MSARLQGVVRPFTFCMLAVVHGQCASYQHVVMFAMLGLLLCQVNPLGLAQQQPQPVAAEPRWLLP